MKVTEGDGEHLNNVIGTGGVAAPMESGRWWTTLICQPKAGEDKNVVANACLVLANIVLFSAKRPKANASSFTLRGECDKRGLIQPDTIHRLKGLWGKNRMRTPTGKRGRAVHFLSNRQSNGRSAVALFLGRYWCAIRGLMRRCWSRVMAQSSNGRGLLSHHASVYVTGHDHMMTSQARKSFCIFF